MSFYFKNLDTIVTDNWIYQFASTIAKQKNNIFLVWYIFPSLWLNFYFIQRTKYQILYTIFVNFTKQQSLRCLLKYPEMNLNLCECSKKNRPEFLYVVNIWLNFLLTYHIQSKVQTSYNRNWVQNVRMKNVSHLLIFHFV